VVLVYVIIFVVLAEMLNILLCVWRIW